MCLKIKSSGKIFGSEEGEVSERFGIVCNDNL
jgi:hypothetical protein